MVLQFSTFGPDLATRRQGEIARDRILELLASIPEGEQLVLSLEGVTMTPSFVDECYGKLLATMGADAFRRKVSVVNADDTTRVLLNVVLSRRLKEHPAEQNSR